MATRMREGALLEAKKAKLKTAPPIQGDPFERRLHPDGIRRHRAAEVLFYDAGKGDPGHAQSPSRGHGHLRDLPQRRGHHQGRASRRVRTQAPAPATMRHGGNVKARARKPLVDPMSTGNER